MNSNYDWIKFYEAAVLETDGKELPNRIEAARHAIGQRVMSARLDDYERRAMVVTLNALTVLKRERCVPRNLICSQCKDDNDVVTPLNGKTFLARITSGEIILLLHTRCVEAWAAGNDCQTLVPLKKMPLHGVEARYRSVA